MADLVEIEHAGIGGSGWVPLVAFTGYWGPVAGWTLVSTTPTTYLPALMRYLGAYGSGINYIPGDVVLSGGVVYVALVPVTAVTPGTDATKWALSGAADGGGESVSDATLKEWVAGEDYELLNSTLDAYNNVTLATVKWPDGSGGTFTVTTVNATHHLVDAYTLTHTASGKTVTQAAVTRNGDGYPTVTPALTVA